MFEAFQVSVQRIRCCVGSWVQGKSLNPCFVAREDPSVQMWGFVGFCVPYWHSGFRLASPPFTKFDRVSHIFDVKVCLIQIFLDISNDARGGSEGLILPSCRRPDMQQ